MSSLDYITGNKEIRKYRNRRLKKIRKKMIREIIENEEKRNKHIV